jgi:uncharacterized RDD family membrane protein YckC
MSTPTPHRPPAPINIEPPSFGGYAGLPGAIEGVGFWPRVGARVIDLIVHSLLGTCTGFLFGILLAIAAAIASQPLPLLLAKLSGGGFTLFVLSLLGSIGYQTICEGVHGSSVGKLVLSMVVVQEDGSPCRLGAALTRSLAYLVDALFFGLIGYFAMQKTPQQQRHGDEWAHTIVRKRSQVPPENLRGGGRFVLALFLAAMVDAALIMTGLLLKVTA